MIVMSVNTTLKDSEGDSYQLGPYLFGSPVELSAWKDEFDMLMADFYCGIRADYLYLEPLLVQYEHDVPILDAVPAPPAKYLARTIRGLWQAGELKLNQFADMAA